MRINNNIQALNAYRNLNQTVIKTSRNMEKLSSGMRINRAADDAAGLAISEKMRSQIRGLKMAERNALDGVSLMQTAEGALQEVHSMLQRMRELAVQAANDTNTDFDRDQIQKEIDQLLKEIDSIAEKTEFNTRKLLNGDSAVNTYVDANGINLLGSPNPVSADLKNGNYQVEITNPQSVVTIKQPAGGLGAAGDVTLAPGTGVSGGGGTAATAPQLTGGDITSILSADLSTIGDLTVNGVTVPLTNVQGLDGTGGTLIVLSDLAAALQADLNAQFDGVAHGGVQFTVSDNGTGLIITSSETGSAANITIDGDAVSQQLGLTDGTNPATVNGTDAIAVSGGGTGTQAGVKLGEYTIKIRDYQPNASPPNASIEVLDPDGLSVETLAIPVGSGASPAVIGGLLIDASKIKGTGTIKVDIEYKAEVAINLEDANGNYGTLVFAKEVTSKRGVMTHGGLEFKFDSNLTAGTAEFSLTNNALLFQIGANTNQNVKVDIPLMDTVMLGIEDVDVTSQESANLAIAKFDEAVNRLSSARAKLGAVQNRLEHTINNLQITHENLAASESRIRDTDMALEMTQFTKNNILNQAGTAMLAQANQLPQGVLQLLQ